RADVVLYSHEHSDHMDRGLFARWKELGTQIWAPEHCRSILLAAGIPEGQVHVARPGESVTLGRVTIDFIRSRHESRGTPYYSDVADQDDVSVAFLIRTEVGNV